jgi:hypothetical protein
MNADAVHLPDQPRTLPMLVVVGLVGAALIYLWLALSVSVRVMRRKWADRDFRREYPDIPYPTDNLAEVVRRAKEQKASCSVCGRICWPTMQDRDKMGGCAVGYCSESGKI